MISMGEEAGAQAGDEKRRMTMKRGWRHCIVGGIAFTAAIALAFTVASTSARADHTNWWDAALVGAVIGGLIGSALDHDPGHRVTVSTGAALGSLYVGHRVSHRYHSGVHQRPMHHQRWWHERRGHRQHWYAHPRRHRHGNHHHGYHRGWKRPHAHPPVLVQPRPRDRNRHHHRPVYGHNTHRDCRVLEHGARPVVACRGRGGHWHIIQ